MTDKDKNVKITFIARLNFAAKENYFTGIPDDLRLFLQAYNGTMSNLCENLYPDKNYEISIQIKSIT